MRNTLSRRTFLGAAAGASLVRLPRLLGAEAGAAGGYLIGVQSFSLRHFDADTAMQHAADIGFGHIEYFKTHLDPLGTDEQIDAVVAKTRQLGLKLLAHGVNRFTADHEANRQYFEFAKRAGLRNLSAMPSKDAFDSLDKLVAEYDVRIAIHNHGPGHEYGLIRDVQKAVRGRHPNVGACVDTGHFIRAGQCPIEAIEKLGKRVFGVHLKDFAGEQIEGQPKPEETILGEGQLDVVGTFRAMRKIQFPADGYISIEYENKKEDPIDDLKACLEIAREAAKKSAG